MLNGSFGSYRMGGTLKVLFDAFMFYDFVLMFSEISLFHGTYFSEKSRVSGYYSCIGFSSRFCHGLCLIGTDRNVRCYYLR